MYRKILLFVFAALLHATSFAQNTSANATSKEQQLVQSLMGTWVLDLRPSPNDAPYLKDFSIKSYEGGVLKGSFYDTPFTNGRIHTAWGKLYFAFTTADNSGTYFHSGFLEDGKLSGTSFSPNRAFVLPWTGVRKQ